MIDKTRSIFIKEKLRQIKKFDKKTEAKWQKLFVTNRFLDMED